jgi:hypothetical protein
MLTVYDELSPDEIQERLKAMKDQESELEKQGLLLERGDTNAESAPARVAALVAKLEYREIGAEHAPGTTVAMMVDDWKAAGLTPGGD